MKRILILSLGLLVLGNGCSSTQYAYREIQKDQGDYNSRNFPATAAQLQKAVIKMLLERHFMIEKEDSGQEKAVVASRYFSKGSDNIIVVVRARMMAEDANHHKLYLNGIQTTQRHYEVDHTRFLLWLIPLPGGGGREVTKTKESEISIEDQSFYSGLFEAVGKNLKD